MHRTDDHREGPRVHAETTDLVQRAAATLLAALDGGTSEHLRAYLAFCAQFHHYSPTNRLLIYAQMPLATRVAGYATWQRLGQHVRAREQGIKILCPRPSPWLETRAGPGDDQQGEQGEQGDAPPVEPDEPYAVRRAVHFVIGHVFDQSQLAPSDTPVPTFFTPLSGDHAQLVAQLITLLGREGIRVCEGATQGAEGYSAHQRIVLRPGLPSQNQALTLLHEYAHELLHWQGAQRDRPRAVQEWQAEATSYLVARVLGIENPFSRDYLVHWHATPQTLLAELDVIQQTAEQILGKLHPAHLLPPAEPPA